MLLATPASSANAPPKTPATAMFNVHVQKAVVFIQEAIIQGRIGVRDPFKLIEEVYKIIQSLMVQANGVEAADLQQYAKQIAFEAIKRIAAGADGISGTDDDLIPVDIVQKIGALLNADLVGSVIDFVASHEAIITSAVELAPSCMEPCKPLLLKLLAFLKKFITQRRQNQNQPKVSPTH